MVKLTTYEKIWYYFNNKRVGFLMRLQYLKCLMITNPIFGRKLRNILRNRKWKKIELELKKEKNNG